jgi:hypothetical protein
VFGQENSMTASAARYIKGASRRKAARDAHEKTARLRGRVLA